MGLPGGTIESDEGESPREGARRETLEEIGLDREPGRLLVVDWVKGPAGRRWCCICTTVACSVRTTSARSGSRSRSCCPGGSYRARS
ncbi:hypothetical protein SHKM778_33880 [Streptomyces sp. KM77-8]|uniref:Nudix hydrolase domain-containing protein n=1 Tax=Streptomyces haneummycinicus TaxID=3074435 RepID=A0AAT9HHX5_9ACTN